MAPAEQAFSSTATVFQVHRNGMSAAVLIRSSSVFRSFHLEGGASSRRRKRRQAPALPRSQTLLPPPP